MYVYFKKSRPFYTHSGRGVNFDPPLLFSANLSPRIHSISVTFINPDQNSIVHLDKEISRSVNSYSSNMGLKSEISLERRAGGAARHRRPILSAGVTHFRLCIALLVTANDGFTSKSL